MKILLSATLAISAIFSSAVVHAQATPAAAPAKAKTVDVPVSTQLEIMRLQRDATSAYAREQNRQKQEQEQEKATQEKANKDINELTSKLGAAIAKAKEDLKLPKEATFNPEAVNFSVPEKK